MEIIRRTPINYKNRTDYRTYIKLDDGKCVSLTTPENIDDQTAFDLAQTSVPDEIPTEIKDTVEMGKTLEETIAFAVQAHKERGEKTSYDDCSSALTKALDGLGIRKPIGEIRL